MKMLNESYIKMKDKLLLWLQNILLIPKIKLMMLFVNRIN